MKYRTLVLLLPLFYAAAASCQPQPQPQKPLLGEPSSAVVVKNFDVFLDPPSGFVFVKLPQGWKFVGKVEESDRASLPPTVITSLLPDERDGVLASNDRQAPSR